MPINRQDSAPYPAALRQCTHAYVKPMTNGRYILRCRHTGAQVSDDYQSVKSAAAFGRLIGVRIVSIDDDAPPMSLASLER